MNLHTMSRKRKHWKYILCVIPILVVWFILSIYPHVEVIPLSLYKWSPISQKRTFVGLEYFKIMFDVQWKITWKQFLNTILYVLYLFGIQTILALSLALVLRKNTRHNKFFRALFFLPMVLSSTMVSLTWSYMYDPNLGIINNLLGNLGVDGFPGHNFFKPDAMALLCIVLVHIWANIGYPITIITSGLQTISDDLEEAARLDGANQWQLFWRVTFPLLLPTLLRITLLTLTTGSMAIDYILMMGSRGDTMSFDTWSVEIYKGITNDSNYGMVSARSVVLFVVMIVFSLIQYRATKKVEDDILG